MKDLNARNLVNTAVYWANPVADGRGGYIFTSGVEIKCRWSVKMERFMTANGEEKVSRAMVRVDQDVVVGGYLFLGGLDDLSTSSAEDNPADEHSAYLIQAFSKIPNLKGDWYSRKTWL